MPERVADRVVLAEAGVAGRARAADDDAVGRLEPAGEPHRVDRPGDVVGAPLDDVERDDEPLGGVLGGEATHVAPLRPAGEAHRLDAAADEPPGEGRVLALVAGVDAGPPAGRVERVGVDLGVGRVVVVPLRPVAAGGVLGEVVTRRQRGDVGPVAYAAGRAEGGVHQVLPVDRRDAGAQQQGREPRRGVGEADGPGGLGRRDRVEVEQVEQVDPGLPAPRRHDRTHGGVEQHPHQLGGPLLSRGADLGRGVQALAEPHLVAPLLQRPDGHLEARPELVLHAGARGGDADDVTGSQGRGVADGAHRATLPDRRAPRHTRWGPSACRPSVAGVRPWRR